MNPQTKIPLDFIPFIIDGDWVIGERKNPRVVRVWFTEAFLSDNIRASSDIDYDWYYYLYDKNINPLSCHIAVEIVKIESPQQKLNIVGLQWLRKDYIVEVKITIDGKEYTGDAKRKTLLFAAALNVENNEVPLNRKAFSKALQRSLEDALKQL
jgi:hypothetical protein